MNNEHLYINKKLELGAMQRLWLWYRALKKNVIWKAPSIKHHCHSSCFLSFTAHEWTYHSRLLVTSGFSESHTGQNIATTLWECHNEAWMKRSWLPSSLTVSGTSISHFETASSKTCLRCRHSSCNHVIVLKDLRVTNELIKYVAIWLVTLKLQARAIRSMENWQATLELPKQRLLQNVVSSWKSCNGMLAGPGDQNLSTTAALQAEFKSDSEKKECGMTTNWRFDSCS